MAAGAEAEYFGRMAGDDVAVVVGRFLRPFFDRATVDFDGSAAGGAHKVMVVGGGVTFAVEGFSTEAVEDIDFASISERLKCSIDSGEPDAATCVNDAAVNVAGRGESVEVSEDVFDGRSLACGPNSDGFTTWLCGHGVLLFRVACWAMS